MPHLTSMEKPVEPTASLIGSLSQQVPVAGGDPFTVPSPGPLTPLSTFFAETFQSPAIMAPPQFIQTLQRSPTSSQTTEAASALLSLKQPVIREQDSGIDLSFSSSSHESSATGSTPCYPPSQPYPIVSGYSNHPTIFEGMPVYGFASVRGRMRPNTCFICGKSYARASTLRTHMRTHNGEKPFQCTICFKSFTQAANLTAHMRTHSGEKPFKCPICERSFSQSSSVTTHLRTHNGERPYKCTLCSKAFADSSTLTKHFRTHSGEKPYHCHICDARFSQSGNLNRHLKTHRNFRI